jgi:pimeloyl-ACP methyl ester carboxylesterase
MLSVLLGILIVVAIAWLAMCALLFFTQESAIFYPGPNDVRLVQQHASRRLEIGSLEGWWVENPAATNDLVIVYFGGNAEDVLYTAGTLPLLGARRMLVVNYRGYGASKGRPGQKELYEDGLAIYDYAVGSGVRPDQLIVMGRSLGSGVASMLAGSREVRAAVLITPFDSLAAVAAGHYPIFPVRLLLRHPFPSADWARKARAPALILAAERDDIVPARHARRLAQAWAGKSEAHVLAGTGHNDIETSPDYYRLIRRFLGISPES